MTNDKMKLRNELVDIALDWQENFGGTCPYESDGITINSQRLNFLFLQACGL